eukprot:COSAG01_NODE_799_length_13501_cov_15.980749_8_plen_58_part_00
MTQENHTTFLSWASGRCSIGVQGTCTRCPCQTLRRVIESPCLGDCTHGDSITTPEDQ